jgi:SAM-dependent methyltransferase
VAADLALRRACPLCLSEGPFETLGVRHDVMSGRLFSMGFSNADVQCAFCGLIFNLSPPPSDTLLTYYRDGFDLASDTVTIENDYDVRWRLETLGRILSPGASVLEVGAGTGDFVAEMNKAGYRAHGIDPLQAARSIPIGDGHSFTGIADESVDCIVSYLVAEHVLHPRDWLLSLASKIKPGGHAVIEVPNFEQDPGSSLNPEHLQHFAPSHLIRLLRSTGFSVDAADAVKQGSRPFAMQAIGTKRDAPRRGTVDSSPGDRALVDRMKHSYAAGLGRLAALKAFATACAAKISDGQGGTSGRTVYLWAVNDYAFRLVEACLARGIEKIVLIDNSKSKIGKKIDGITDPIRGADAVVNACPDSIFVICSPSWFGEISRQVRDLVQYDPLIVPGFPD